MCIGKSAVSTACLGNTYMQKRIEGGYKHQQTQTFQLEQKLNMQFRSCCKLTLNIVNSFPFYCIKTQVFSSWQQRPCRNYSLSSSCCVRSPCSPLGKCISAELVNPSSLYIQLFPDTQTFTAWYSWNFPLIFFLGLVVM